MSEHFQINGPDYGTAPTLGTGFDMSQEDTDGFITGKTTHFEISVMAGGGFAMGGEAKAFAGVNFSYDYERNSEDYKSGITSASVALQSSNPCYHQGVDVYFDMLFGTYFFVATDNGSSSCSELSNVNGFVNDAAGQPIAGSLVHITLQNGQTWATTTDAGGRYKFHGVPSPVSTTVAVSGAVLVPGDTVAPVAYCKQYVDCCGVRICSTDSCDSRKCNLQ